MIPPAAIVAPAPRAGEGLFAPTGRKVIAQGKAKRRPGFAATRLWVIAIDSSCTRTASEGHATLGASPLVKWVCDPFVNDRDRFVPYTHGLGGPCYAPKPTYESPYSRVVRIPG